MTVHGLSFVQYLGFYVQSSFPQGAEFSTSFPQVFHRVDKNSVHFAISCTVEKTGVMYKHAQTHANGHVQ
jgi:hypothetical protein